MKERITYFDFLRGIAILMVIGIHSYYVVPFDTWGNIARINNRELINFAVPLFLAISGYFIGKKRIEAYSDYWQFVKKQIPRVYVPLLIWSAPTVAMWMANGKFWIVAILQGMICAAFGPYYFILLIMQLYLLHPVIAKAADSKLGGGVFIVLINVTSLLLFCYILTHYSLPFVFLVSPFVYWIAFYYVGVYLSHHSRDYSISWILVFLTAGAVAQLMTTGYAQSAELKGWPLVFANYSHSLSAWIYEMSAVLLLLSAKAERCYEKHQSKLTVIWKIGVYAFGIYLVHVYFQKFIEDYTDIHTWSVKWLLMTVASVTSVLLLAKILPIKIQRILGLK